MLFNVHQSTLLFHLALEYIKYCDIEEKNYSGTLQRQRQSIFWIVVKHFM